MECSCEVDCDSSDSAPDVHKIYIRKANKEHKCGECGRTISKAETYELVSGLWDGSWQHYKTCDDCLSLRNEFFATYFFGEIWEYFYEYVSECYGDIPEKCLAVLKPRAREKALGIIEKYQND